MSFPHLHHLEGCNTTSLIMYRDNNDIVENEKNPLGSFGADIYIFFRYLLLTPPHSRACQHQSPFVGHHLLVAIDDMPCEDHKSLCIGTENS